MSIISNLSKALPHGNTYLRRSFHLSKCWQSGNALLFNGRISASTQHLGLQNRVHLGQRDYRTSILTQNESLINQRKEKGKSGKGGKTKKNEDSEGGSFDFDRVKKLLQQPLDSLRRDLETIRAVRSSPALIEKIVVDTGSGNRVPLSSLAQVIVKDPQVMQVNLFDESALKAVEKAIRESELQLSPQVEGKVIKIRTPKLTTEYRENLKKMAIQSSEKAKVNVRQARKTAMDDLKKADLPEDEEKRTEKQVQNMIDEAVKSITQITDAKVKEISST